LIDFPISGSHRRMGRPPLNVRPIVIRLPVAAITRIREIVGESGLAQFVREAVENELKRREAGGHGGKPKPTKPAKARSNRQ
jgi:hypothetical protein